MDCNIQEDVLFIESMIIVFLSFLKLIWRKQYSGKLIVLKEIWGLGVVFKETELKFLV